MTDQLDISNWANPFFWEACFLFPRALDFDFCYDLDLCSQGQAMEAFSFGMVFSLMLSKVQEGGRTKHSTEGKYSTKSTKYRTGN